jgi:hypothetical protein
MFGQHAARRAKNRAMKAKQALNQQKAEWEKNAPARELEQQEAKKKMVADKTAQSEANRNSAFDKGVNKTEEFLKREVEGLDPKHKQALQYEANKGIKQSYQNANRKLLGEQAQNGIQGRGGVGFSQQMTLQDMARNNQNQVTRDVNKLDHDTALKRQAQIFAGGKGEEAQALLDAQAAEDELNLLDEKKRQRSLEDQFFKQYQQFTRA